MKLVLPIFLLLLCCPFSGFGGTLYTYTGNPMICMDACPDGTHAMTATLTFGSSLAANTEYAIAGYLSLFRSSGAVNTTGLLESWTMSDGVYTSPASPDLFALYLKTDSAGNIVNWVLGMNAVLSSGEMLILATQNDSVSAADQTVYQTPESFNWSNSELPGAWSASVTNTPEPATVLLTGLSLGMLAFWRARARR